MSRLDSFVRRLIAQRECLNMAARLVARVPGPVLELGLGNGRTFDHLQAMLPDREIFVFDRQLTAHPDCIPGSRHLVLGEFRDTLPGALGRIGRPAALAHADIGSGDAVRDAETVALLRDVLPRLLHPHGAIVSDQGIAPSGWYSAGLPDGVEPDRYFIYRRDAR